MPRSRSPGSGARGSPGDLARALQHAADDYARLKREGERAVVRWVWATGPLEDRLPVVVPGTEGSVGEVLPRPPRKKAGAYEIGFDAAGRRVVVRRHTPFEDAVIETFVTHGDGEVTEWAFEAYPKVPSRVRRYVYEGARLVSYASVSPRGSTDASYTYEGDRLVEVRRRTERDEIVTTRLAYDAGGTLVRVSEVPRGGSGSVVYERAARPLAPSLEEMGRLLVGAIPELVGRLGVAKADPAFGLLLAYDAESPTSVLPPMLGIGLESERARWAKRARRSAEELWAPDALASFQDERLDFDERVTTLGREIGQHLRKKATTEPARKLLVEVAKALCARDWSKTFPVTKDFVVYPLDLEMADLARNMKAILSPAELAARRARREL